MLWKVCIYSLRIIIFIKFCIVYDSMCDIWCFVYPYRCLQLSSILYFKLDVIAEDLAIVELIIFSHVSLIHRAKVFITSWWQNKVLACLCYMRIQWAKNMSVSILLSCTLFVPVTSPDCFTLVSENHRLFTINGPESLLKGSSIF